MVTMTEAQRVSKCKLCPAEITWHKDPVSGKNYPKNLDGSPHRCMNKTADPAKTAEQLRIEKEEYNKKAQAAGFNTGTCTSPETPPVTSPKTIEGQIITLDLPAHKVWLKDREGKEHYFIWGPALNDQMSKLKPYYFAKLTGEYEKDVDLWRLTDQGYFKRPDDWPFSKAGGKGFQARNDKAIILQTCLKVAADVFISRGFCEENDPPYSKQMEDITAEAIKAAEALCKAGGV